MRRWPPSPWTPSLLLPNSAVTCPVWSLELTVLRYHLVMHIDLCVDVIARVWLWVFGQVAEQLSKVQGVKKVLVAQHEAYKGLLPGKPNFTWFCSWVCVLNGRFTNMAWSVWRVRDGGIEWFKWKTFFHRGADASHLGNPETVQFHTHLCGSFCFRKGKSRAEVEDVGLKGWHSVVFIM